MRYSNKKINTFKNNLILPKSFYIVIIGDSISRIGDYIYQLGIPIYILSLTGSPLWMATSFAIQQCAIIFSGLLSGTVVDRSNPKKVLVYNALLQTILIAVIPILHKLSMINIYFILIDGFFLTASGFLYKTAINSLIPNIVKKERLPLASSQISLSKFISKTIGPTLAGIVISVISPINSLWIDGISFLLVFVLMKFVDFNDEVKIQIKDKNTIKSFTRDLQEGFKIVLGTDFIFSLVILNFMLNIGYVSMFSMFIYHLSEILNFQSQTIGLIYSADGLAVIMAGFLLPIIMKKIMNGKLIIYCSAIMGLCILSLGYISSGLLVGGIFGIIMYCSQTINRVMYTLWQMNISKEQLGRVFSISSTLESLSVPLAGMISGIIVENYESFTLFKISGIIIILSTLLCTIFTKVTQIDNRIVYEKNTMLK